MTNLPSTSNTLTEQIRARQRRAIVARIATQGNFTINEISEILSTEENFINPQTGQPYSLATISKDLQALREEWAKKAFRDTAEMIAEQDHKLDEIERMAWDTGQLDILIKAWDRRQKLHGLDAREVVEMAAIKSKLVQLLIDGEIDESTLIREIGEINARPIIESARVALFEAKQLPDGSAEYVDGEFDTI